jgi:hypothetical protein
LYFHSKHRKVTQFRFVRKYFESILGKSIYGQYDVPACFVLNHDGNQRKNMPQGDKSSYTGKQKRQAEHIEEGYESRGVGSKEAKRRAWATVNKSSHGGKKSGSGRGKKESHASSRKGGRIGGRAKTGKR